MESKLITLDSSDIGVSVIVPVYKVEDYLYRCFDSLSTQDLDNIELLLIDDGSPDRCGEICEEYAAKDPRFHVFHKENSGLSSARNYGIDINKRNSIYSGGFFKDKNVEIVYFPYTETTNST